MNKGFRILKWIVVCILFVLLFGWITMTLWNWLVPALFNGPVVTFAQALGLLVLSKILLSGLGGKRWGGHYGPMHLKHRYYEKLSRMSPEEREQFKAKLREKWCHGDRDSRPGNSADSNV